MRKHELLPNYLLEANGDIIDTNTGEIVQLINRTEYRLQTAEKVYLETLNKTIELVRRFTKDKIISLYRDAKEVTSFKNKVSQKPEKTLSVKTAERAETIKNSNSEKTTFSAGQQIQINGTTYDSISKASKELNIGKATIDRRLKSSDFPTYIKL